jgi:hypothetical protein
MHGRRGFQRRSVMKNAFDMASVGIALYAVLFSIAFWYAGPLSFQGNVTGPALVAEQCVELAGCALVTVPREEQERGGCPVAQDKVMFPTPDGMARDCIRAVYHCALISGASYN